MSEAKQNERMVMPRTPAEKLAWVWGCPMNPCPNCKGYNIKVQAPIDKQEAYFRCFDCGHRSESANCAGLTHAEISKSKSICDEAKRLWNSQKA